MVNISGCTATTRLVSTVLMRLVFRLQLFSLLLFSVRIVRGCVVITLPIIPYT